MDTTDWRTQLQPDSRQKIIDKIMETLKRHLPVSGPEDLVELSKIATRFEEKIYTTGTSQPDYLRKISMKMITMETKSQTTGKRRKANTIQSNSAGTARKAKTIQSNSAGTAQNPPDSGQSQIPLSQNVENTIVNTGVQSSANLPSALPSVTSLTHTSTTNASAQSTNILSSQTGQDAIDWSWRITLQPDTRQKQLNRILETLKHCFPICGSVGLVELDKIAELFEEDIYTAAKSHSDYLHKIYLKILKMETRFQPAGNA